MPLPVSLYGRDDMSFEASSDGGDAAPALEGTDGHGPPGADLPDVSGLGVIEGENTGLDGNQVGEPEFADQPEQATASGAVGQPGTSKQDLLEDDDTVVASEELSPALTSQALKPDTVDLEASERAARGLLVKITSTSLVAHRALRPLNQLKNEADGQRARKPRVTDSGPPDNIVSSAMPSRVVPKPAYYRRD